MDLTPYLEGLRSDLAALAAPGGPETARAAELLSTSLEPSARLALLEALSDAAAEITTRLHDATVEVRLRGRDAELVVNQFAAAEPPVEAPAPVAAVDGGDLARLTLRMPEGLKAQVEQTAAVEGISVNAWLVRAVATAITPRPVGPPPSFGGAVSAKRVTGYFQA
ncbi:hypothetical protein BJY16_007951 [Actinoplanes octamycinicus]|uniref:HicB-like protein involved in pilus formation n=1 Tax=Actinoplanes octamycinicus TaxID=135948 RepID=A0A7W7H621_9ACTN|nr:hypothetical protein [Actinoplanes octamycinicus]MBB4744492.1 hypothetical protein [Actinoplanes octamycinicus]GIE61590.1 hypothetical protein Aoc01nite_69920 [Actinoplanes octamycinicus]